MARSHRPHPDRPTSPIRSRVVAVVAATALVVSACGSEGEPSADTAAADQARGGGEGGGGDGATTSTTSTTVAIQGGGGAATTTSTTSTTVAGLGGGGAATTTIPPETTSTTTTSTTTTSTTTTTLPPDGSDCLVGVWRLRSQEFLDEIIATVGNAANEITEWSHVGGEYLVTMGADGSYRGQRLEWQMRMGTAQGAIVTTISSDDTGTYSVDGNMITVQDNGGPADVRIQLDTGAGLQDVPFGQQQTGTDAISGTGRFECAANTLTITLVDYPGTTGDFTVNFDRA